MPHSRGWFRKTGVLYCPPELFFVAAVHPDLLLVFANFFLFTRVSVRENFPTFDLPANAISANRSSGYWEESTALFMNSADGNFHRHSLYLIRGGDDKLVKAGLLRVYHI